MKYKLTVEKPTRTSFVVYSFSISGMCLKYASGHPTEHAANAEANDKNRSNDVGPAMTWGWTDRETWEAAVQGE